MGIAAAAAALRYAEVKAAAGGATSIQGSPPLTRAFPGWMVRNIEKEQVAAHGDDQLIFQAVIKADVTKLRSFAPRLAGGALVHLPPRRGHGAGAARRVRRPAHGRAACTPTSSASTRRRSGAAEYADWADRGAGADRVVAVLQHLAVRRHDRRARGPAPRDPRLPRLGLGAVGHEEPARRAQGRRAVERRGARRRARRPSSSG